MEAVAFVAVLIASGAVGLAWSVHDSQLKMLREIAELKRTVARHDQAHCEHFAHGNSVAKFVIALANRQSGPAVELPAIVRRDERSN